MRGWEGLKNILKNRERKDNEKKKEEDKFRERRIREEREWGSSVGLFRGRFRESIDRKYLERIKKKEEWRQARAGRQFACLKRNGHKLDGERKRDIIEEEGRKLKETIRKTLVKEEKIVKIKLEREGEKGIKRLLKGEKTEG